MLGVTSALASEFVSGVGLKQQIAEAPLSILGAFVIISLASYIPIFRYCHFVFAKNGSAKTGSALLHYYLWTPAIKACSFDCKQFFCRGFTRKEPFANSFWSPKAENWNGR